MFIGFSWDVHRIFMGTSRDLMGFAKFHHFLVGFHGDIMRFSKFNGFCVGCNENITDCMYTYIYTHICVCVRVNYK
jgi:hypothetical protein